MRLWSLHPQYLDAKGLVALWREGLLAQKVLLGNTKGYKHHPQLIRFRQSEPLACIAYYLHTVQLEASSRQYNFDRGKIINSNNSSINSDHIKLTRGQLEFEWQHLMQKLLQRDPQHYILMQDLITKQPLIAHPLFDLIDGGIESWEKLSS